jgi:protein CMS1
MRLHWIRWNEAMCKTMLFLVHINIACLGAGCAPFDRTFERTYKFTLVPASVAVHIANMGDAIIEDTWDGEHEIDLAQNYNSGDEFSEDISVEGEPVVSEKLSKKRKKFEEFKLKKKLKLQEEPVVEAQKAAVAKQQSKAQPFQPEEMLAMFEAHRPGNIGHSNEADFSVSDFVYAGLDEGSTTKSEKNKKVCSFVRALSANMPGYKKLLLNKAPSKEDYGCPLLLVVCSSAIRATQVIKSMSAKLIKCKIAKLFAKHFKVEEQMEMLSKEYFPIALGTPNRIAKLIEVGALSLRRTALVLLDVTPDSKQFTLLTLNEVKADTYRLLYNHVLPEKGHLKLAMVRE